MKRRRPYLLIVLMIMAIIAIISFQAYWLYKNYQEEKQALRVQTNILFHEAVYQCQAKKMKLDTSIKFRHVSAGNIRVITALQGRLRDTLAPKAAFKSKVLIREEKERFPFPKGPIEVEMESGNVKKLFTSLHQMQKM